MRKLFLFLLTAPLLLAESVAAHCPLCTIGAGAAAGAAVWLGVSKVVVALFIGAFAMSMGMWFSRVIRNKFKKTFVPFQDFLMITAIFFLTVLPILPIVSALGPLYISWIGNYGSLLNNTYMIDYSLISSLFGGILVFFSPKLNAKIKEKRGKQDIVFQGIVITFTMLVIAGIIIQFIV